MGFGLTAAVTLLQCGPPLVLYLAFIAPRSLLILVTLASAFLWASALLVISVLLGGLVTDDGGLLRHGVIVSIAVLLEEAIRYGIYWPYLHRRGGRVLESLAASNPVWHFKPADEVLIAFAVGYGHGVAHALVFSVSWLAFATGKGVLHTATCSSLSWAPAASLMGIGFFLLHCGSMPVACVGLAEGQRLKAYAPGVLHLAAALATVLNVAFDSCVVVAAAVNVLGCCMLAMAGALYHRKLTAPSFSAVQSEDFDVGRPAL